MTPVDDPRADRRRPFSPRLLPMRTFADRYVRPGDPPYGGEDRRIEQREGYTRRKRAKERR